MDSSINETGFPEFTFRPSKSMTSGCSQSETTAWGLILNATIRSSAFSRERTAESTLGMASVWRSVRKLLNDDTAGSGLNQLWGADLRSTSHFPFRALAIRFRQVTPCRLGKFYHPREADCGDKTRCRMM